MHEQQGLKFFTKPPKGKMKALLIVLAWILLWNTVFQILHGVWHEMPVVSWAFFISITIFFMQEELTYKARFWHTLVGGSVGLLMAAGLVFIFSILAKSGVHQTVSTLIPIFIFVTMLILLNPYLPMFFNNVGFCYFIIALIDAESAVAMLPQYLLSLLLGSIILNLGCSGLLALYTKAITKKAMAKAQKETVK